MVGAVVVLDSGPLGLLTHSRRSAARDDCRLWLQSLIDGGRTVLVPEIADYELRRELLRINKQGGLRRLDALESQLQYLPITTAAMRRAAELWAHARQTGQPTAADDTIDIDMILISQVETVDAPNVLIATTNVGHLARFTAAMRWQDIT
jgi:predicted nucleic acid-binding protein